MRSARSGEGINATDIASPHLAEKHAFRYGYALLYNLGKHC